MQAPLDPQDPRHPERGRLTPDEERARKRRIFATGLALAAFALLIFLVSMARLQSNIAAGPPS